MIQSFKSMFWRHLFIEDLTTVGSGFKEHARRRQSIRFKNGADNIGAFDHNSEKKKKKETVADP